jgi:hypothetical protein
MEHGASAAEKEGGCVKVCEGRRIQVHRKKVGELRGEEGEGVGVGVSGVIVCGVCTFAFNRCCRNTSLMASSLAASSGVCPSCSQRQMMR